MNTSTKRIKPDQVQIGDLIMRGYRGAMLVSTIAVREGMVHYYDSKGTLWCHKLNGWATIVTKKEHN